MAVVTIVLRLVAERLAHGEIVGQAEDVATGERSTLRSADDLLAAVKAAAPEAVTAEPAGG
jgi:hypothetical protein